MFREKDPDKLIKDLENNITLYETTGLIKSAILFKSMLGEHYENSGKYLDAEMLFTEAYQDALKNIPVRNTGYYLISRLTQKTVFDPIDRLAYFYLTIGNLRKAEELFKESQKLRDAYFPPGSVHRIHPVIGMGSLFFRKGQYESTYEYFNQADEMLKKAITTGYDFDNLNRQYLNDMAEICMITGRKKDALKYIDKLAVASSGRGKYVSKIASDLEIARIFEMKARYYLSERNFNKSKEYLDKAKQYNPERVAVSDVKFKLWKTEALLYWYQGNIDLAGSAFKNLIEQYRDHIGNNFISLTEYEKEQFYYSLKSDFDLFNAFVVDNAVLYEELYNNVLSTKALLLNESNRIKNRIILSDDQQLISQFHEWERSKANLAALYYQKGSEGDINSLQNIIETLEDEINQASGLFQNREDPPGWEQVKESLKEGEAALEIVRVNVFDASSPNPADSKNGLSDSTVYLVMMLKKESPAPECFILENGIQLETRYLSFYRNSIFLQVEDWLTYDQYWSPITNHLKDIQRVYLSPDGVYNQINLNTLKNPVTGKYLIDEIELVNLTNTGDLIRDIAATENRNAILIGRPSYDFDLAKNAVTGDISQESYGYRNLGNAELLRFREQVFVDLPGTENEINEIGSVLSNQDLDIIIYKGIEALEEKVKSAQNPELLHIATHGFFVDDTASAVSPMIRSGIVLAGVRNIDPDRSEDGILTAYEATNLNLDGTNLVVLSACQTGLGEVRNGEGVYGLQRAVIVAGARNLLMSLWKVDDAATAELMVNFYNTWDGTNNHEAFRRAQFTLRDKYPEPIFWGAFVILGK
ncbi:CHAT domain-containing protein [Bacteroidota bacterium]